MMNRPPAILFRLFLLISIIEGIIVAAVLFAIPGDPKNAFLFGYSKSRLVLLTVVLLLVFMLEFVRFNAKIREGFFYWLKASRWLPSVMPWIGGFFALLLWLTIWTPAYRLQELAASFTRVQPLLIWLELLLVQFSALVWVDQGNMHFRSALVEAGRDKKLFFLGIGLLLITVLVFTALALLGGNFSGNQLYFPPGAPLSALQVLLAWLVFFLFFLMETRSRKRRSQRKIYVVLAFLGIWALTFIACYIAPLPCTDDRPGPFPPNYVCYPNVNDAVYSIGSHYITLGQGVNNHWLTDKPLYMAFLALGQAVAGQNIEKYLAFQVAVVALIPALLFLVLRRKLGNAFGLLVALLMALQELYAILLYREVGSVNVKLENPEVLTALVLLLLGVTLFYWLKKPAESKWAILSGGMLGLAVLLRFNPFFIAPLVLIAILWTHHWKIRKIVAPLVLFVLAFALVFTPWFFSASDKDGNNYYFTKIAEVISSRFINKPEITIPVPPVPAASDDTGSAQKGGSSAKGLLTYDLGRIDKAGPSGIFFHFLNNEYTGLAKLPTTLVFYPIRDQVNQGIWGFTEAKPLWKEKITAENLIALSISLVFVLLGVFTAWKRFGAAGLSGLIIQTGYYTGNALAQTSGGRYLEPVFWVTLLYYCLGIFTLTRFGVKMFSRKSRDAEENCLSEDQDVLVVESALAGIRKNVPLLLGACLLVGLILPALNLVPSRLPEEAGPAIESTTFEMLSRDNLVSAVQWESFIKDRNAVVIQGRAYDARYYRGNFYRAGNLSFELMILAKEHVFVAYSPRIVPRDKFSDNSQVILVGCRLGSDSLWAADRVVAEMIAVIQLDHEGNLLADPGTVWSCSP